MAEPRDENDLTDDEIAEMWERGEPVEVAKTPPPPPISSEAMARALERAATTTYGIAAGAIAGTELFNLVPGQPAEAETEATQTA